ncbi:heme uptake protein IsdC [Cohnella laeviribosi]|uniref:heme uptake protein IsdC n=1 Tax=Cohnella laeviribosi TaxID=380174 RepID=UPI003D235DC4
MRRLLQILGAWVPLVWLAALLASCPTALAASDLADGTYTIDYVIKRADDDSVSIANDYFDKPAEMTVENGAATVKIRMNHSAWITEFMVPVSGSYVDAPVVASDKEADTRTVRFGVDDLSSPLAVKMHVTVESIDYDHDYTVRFVFDTGSAKLVKAADKPADKPAGTAKSDAPAQAAPGNASGAPAGSGGNAKAGAAAGAGVSKGVTAGASASAPSSPAPAKGAAAPAGNSGSGKSGSPSASASASSSASGASPLPAGSAAGASAGEKTAAPPSAAEAMPSAEAASPAAAAPAASASAEAAASSPAAEPAPPTAGQNASAGEAAEAESGAPAVAPEDKVSGRLNAGAAALVLGLLVLSGAATAYLLRRAKLRKRSAADPAPEQST